MRVGSRVTIVVSNGIGTISLDDYVGQEADFAEGELADLELDVSIVTREVSDPSEDGIVLAQAPSPGSRLSPGDRVTLTVGEYTKPEETTTTTDTTTTDAAP